MPDRDQPRPPPSWTGHHFQHVQVNEGARAQLGDTYHIGQENPLSLLPFATNAPFNSYHLQDKPTCLPNTRVDVLQNISQWGDGGDQQCLFWLSGMAGTGKTTIAHTVARSYLDEGRLAGSFFFSRGGGDAGNAHKFVTTIAVQLAMHILPVRQYIRDAVIKYSNIASQSLIDQWRQLVLEPLSKLGNSDTYPSYIVVIDALDECEGETDIRIILRLLAEAQSLKKVRLRVLVTSRPEVPIRYGFCQILNTEHRNFVLHDIEAAIVDHDISIFLEYNLRLIGQENAQEPGWPGLETLQRLVETASGLFIWASASCRFIREGLSAEGRLRMLLQGSNAPATPEEHLNSLYTTILRNSIQSGYIEEERQELYGMLRVLLGSIVILFSPLSVDSFSRLLHITKQQVDQTLKNLHAILDIRKELPRPLRLHHPSFRDFLLDNNRCKDLNFWVDEKQAHQRLADSCIQLMSTSLTQDICGLNTPGVLVTDVESSRVERSLPPEVQYACLYWIQHLQKSSAQLRDNDQVHQFLQQHLLHWLEALGWMRKVSEGIHAITSLEAIVAVYECPRLSEFIYDTKRFVLYNRLAIEQAPFQTYCSALVFTPAVSMVRKQFKECVPRWMRRLPEVENNWNALLQTLEGHSGSVWAVAFSSDGKLLASASGDKTVKLWDTGSGAALQTLEGHSDSVNAVAFSPDGKLLASASWDKTIKLWDSDSGAVVQTLEGYSGSVYTVAFSWDGKLLASASDDTTVKLWDFGSGAVLQTLEGHSGLVNAVVFSPVGKLLASVSNDKTVKLWEAGSGAVLQTLEGHLDSVYAVAFSSDGKLLASASGDKTVKLWEAGSGAALQTLEGHLASVRSVAFSPDGKLLASASGDKTVKLWDTGLGAALQTLEGHSGWVWAVAFSPDGKTLASASDDKTINLWEAGSGAALQILEGHSGWVWAIVFSPDGKLLASASDDARVKLWDSGSGAVLQTLEGHSDSVYAVAFSPDGKLLASASGDKTVKLWKVDSGVIVQTLEGHFGSVYTVAFSWDGELLASASGDETVRLWDSGSGAVLQIFRGHSGLVNAVAFSSDSKLVASVSGDKTVKIWDTGSGVALQALEVNTAFPTLSLSNDGTLVQNNRGPLCAVFLADGAAVSQPNLPCSISVKEQWVSLNMENLLWLPSDHRPSCIAIHGSIVGFGYRSGRVSVMEFAF